ncbi:hypothetical protein Tco_0585546 [Tanacetum coccineum]
MNPSTEHSSDPKTTVYALKNPYTNPNLYANAYKSINHTPDQPNRNRTGTTRFHVYGHNPTAYHDYTPHIPLSISNVESGAGDEDYVQKAMIHYEIDTGVAFKLRHCWYILKDHPKWQEMHFHNIQLGSRVQETHFEYVLVRANSTSGEQVLPEYNC